MILYYPMIVSNTINPTIIPALAKAVERFVLIYKLNDVTEAMGAGIPGILSVATQGGRITANFGLNENLDLQEQRPSPGEEGTKDKQKDKEKAPGKIEIPTRNLEVGEADKKSLMLEPTYMMVDLEIAGERTTRLLGIKVLPMMAKSEQNLVDYLMFDRYSKGVQRVALMWGRSIMKAVQRLIFRNKARLMQMIRLLGPAKRPEPSGDPHSDILLRNTAYSDGKVSNMFVAINKADLPDDFAATSAMRQMFKLGWDNIIFVDDVNKIVSFCFKTFRGMCSQIPYQMMYATLGREQREAYESVEDVRRASSSIFKRKANLKQVLEMKTKNTKKLYEIYLENQMVYSEIEILTEDFAKYFKGINFKRFLDTMTKSYKKGNVKKFTKALGKMRLPDIDMMKVQQKARQRYPEFNKSYQFAKRVLENSLPDGINNKMVDLAAMSVAIVSLRNKSMGVMKATIEFVKNLVKKFRKTKAESQRLKIPKAYWMEMSLGWSAIGLLLTLAIGTPFSAIKGITGLAKDVPALDKEFGASLARGIPSEDVPGLVQGLARVVGDAGLIATSVIVITLVTNFLIKLYKSYPEKVEKEKRAKGALVGYSIPNPDAPTK